MKPTLFTGAFVFAAASFPHAAFAQTSAELLQEGLNAVTEVSSADTKTMTLACERLNDVIAKIAPFITQYPQLARLEQKLRDLENKLCENSQPGTENAPSYSLAWRTPPQCNTSVGPIHNCTFRHENGRGLFTLGQKDKHSFPNSLVCATTAGAGTRLFETDYVITSRCLVSEIDWSSPGGRSDVSGLFQWLQKPAPRTPIELPVALAQQCETTFPEAAYCSPTLVVLPTRDNNIVDVCALQTQRREVNAVVFRVASSTSRWNCETKDLRVPDAQKRLAVREWDCVPDMWGNIHNECILPYIPTTDHVRSRDTQQRETPFIP